MKDNLKKDTIDSVKWNALAHLTDKGINYLLILILARILTPEEFGLIAMVTVFTLYFTTIHEFCLAGVVIQKKNLQSSFINTVFSLNISIGIALSVILYFSSYLIASLYDNTSLILITKVIALSFVLNALSILPIARLRKEFKFKKIFFINFFTIVISSIITLYLAFYLKLGLWSLVYHFLFVAFLKSLISFILLPNQFVIEFDKQSLVEIRRFCIPLLGSKSLFYWTSYFDFVIVGKFFNQKQLGLYSQSNTMIEISSQSITSIVGNVLFSSFSKVRDDISHVKRIYISALSTVSAMTLPINLSLILLADPFVKTIFNPNWEPMIPIIQALSILGAAKSIAILNGNVFMSLAETKTQFKINLFTRPLILLFVILGINFGLLGVIYGKVLGVIIGNIINFYFLLKLIFCHYKELFKAILPPFICSLIMILLVKVCDIYILTLGLNEGVRLIILMLLCAIIYFISTYFFNRTAILKLKEILKSVI